MDGKKTVAVITAAVLAVCAFLYRIPKKKSLRIFDALGTISEITLYNGESAVLDECRTFIYYADSLFSHTDPKSEISLLNNHERVRLSPETEELLEIGTKWSDGHTFNIFCGALCDEWEKAKESDGEYLPNPAAIESAYPFSLEITDSFGYLKNPEQKINLGALAKGYVTEKTVEILKSHSVKSALINLGGNIYALGEKPGGKKWTVGVQDPDGGSVIGTLSANDEAIVTSGDYERFFERNGKRYCHIIDPKTGISADSGLRSVTVISKSPTIADILSTKCFIAGLEKGKEILKEQGAYGIFVTDEHEVYLSSELSERFICENEKYDFFEF